MIIVITTVGTSLFENFLKKNNAIKNQYETIKDKPYSESKNYKGEIDQIKKNISTIVNNPNASAEVKTLIKLEEEAKDSLEVHFLCSDTIVSNLAAQIIKDHPNNTFSVKGIHNLQGLQINNYEQYDTVGFSSLIAKFKEIAVSNNPENHRVILNISGGYKAIIPPLTILGQIYGIQVVYIYEDSDELIYFPSLPVHFDWSLSEEYYPYLQEISGGKQIKSDSSTDEMLEMHLLRKTNSDFKITPLGKIFKEYIESEMPLADNTLGFFVEYKLLEYLMENPYENRFKNIAHSKKIENRNEKREIDLILKDESNEQIVILESKSFLQVYRNNDFQKLKEQINAQVKILKEGNYNIYEYHLSIHHTNFLVYDSIMKNLKELKTMIENAFDNKVKFKTFSLKVNLNLRDRNYYRNPYQKFLSQPIVIKEIKIS